jgi:hypothetical protein
VSPQRDIWHWLLIAAVILGFAVAAPAASAALARWGQPVLADPVQAGDGPNGNLLGAVSCASTSFCGAVDGSGYVTMWKGRTWSQPLRVDTTGNPLNSVSCPSSTFCAAVDGGGYVSTFDGQTWSRLEDIDDQLYFWSVSCPSASFCLAAGDFGPGPNQILTFNGRGWSKPQNIDENGGNEIIAVSCSSASFCVAIDDAGNVLSFRNGVWSGPVRIERKYALDDVSCSSPSFCAAVGNPYSSKGEEVALTFNGSGWSAPTRIDNGTALNATCAGSMVSPCVGLSCPSASFCMAVNDLDDAVTWNGHRWGRPTSLDSPRRLVTAVACVTRWLCMATDTNGYAIEYGIGPVLSRLRLSHASFPAGTGTLVSYRDSATALTTFRVIAELPGIAGHGKCVAPPNGGTQLSAVGRCERLMAMGSFSHEDQPGANRLRFGGRLGGHDLAAGHYLLKLSAARDHLISPTISKPFVITNG